MSYQHGELVVVLDTTQKAVGSAIVQVYYPELHSLLPILYILIIK